MYLEAVPELKSFGASEFKSWKRKVQFGMKYMDIFYTVSGTMEEAMKVEKDLDEPEWKKNEDFCREYLLINMSDMLASTYSKFLTAKEVWDALDAQFKEEEEISNLVKEQSSKIPLVDKFMSFSFSDNKEISPQVAELENLVQELRARKVEVCDEFFAGVIIFKLPATWHSFKSEMFWRRTHVELDELKRFIRIEDEFRTRDKLEIIRKQASTTDVVQSQQVRKFNKPSKSNKKHSPSVAVCKSDFKKRQPKVKCYYCQKGGHVSSECRGPRKDISKPSEMTNRVTRPSNFVAAIGKDKVDESFDWILGS